MKRLIVVAFVVVFASTWTFADQVTYDFTGTGRVAMSIMTGTASHTANTGGEPSNRKIQIGSRGGNLAWDPIFYAPLPDCVVGKTIISAYFTMNAVTWSGEVILDNANLHRLNYAGPLIEQGNGTWATRSIGGQIGATYDFPANIHSNVNWQGGTGFDAAATVASAIGELIDTQDGLGYNGGYGVMLPNPDWSDNETYVPAATTWNITTLVGKWASGEWTNQGFIIWLANSVQVWTSWGVEARCYFGDYNDATIQINFTEPVPEPATIVLFGTGVLTAIGVLRRRRMR